MISLGCGSPGPLTLPSLTAIAPSPSFLILSAKNSEYAMLLLRRPSSRSTLSFLLVDFSCLRSAATRFFSSSSICFWNLWRGKLPFDSSGAWQREPRGRVF